MRRVITRIGDAFARAENFFLTVAMIALTAVVSIQIVARNTGHYVFWTEDVSILLFTWVVFIGSAGVVRRRAHYLMDVWDDKHVRLKRFLCLFSALLVAVYTCLLIWQGVNMSWLVRGRESGAGGIGMGYYFISLPIGSFLSIVHLVEATLQEWDRKENSP
jgi:TRAP-type transport system small permease protein